jgi:serine/threonine protein kinase
MTTQIFKERYAIQKQLAKNDGRHTWLAQDLQTKELVVIKLLIFESNFQWDELKLFEREAQTLQRLSHPAIPRYLDYFDVDISIGKGFALVQSYIPAKSLEQWLKSGRRFSEADIKQLAQTLLKILRYLHRQQPPVIHRDIKPSNILLANRSGNSVDQVYLVDFGSVQTLAAKQGSTITVVGTYGYMPPEQFGGRTVPASDLYSLGATLIYLVTGRHPAELPQENLRIQFESSVNLSPNLINWLKWMTQPSLNRRLASAKEALKALEHPPKKTDTDISAVGQKPFGSRIKVKKNGKNIEILIPQKGLKFDRKFWLSMFQMLIFGLMGLFFIIGFILGIGIFFESESLIAKVAVLYYGLIVFYMGFFSGRFSLTKAYEIFRYIFRVTRLNLNPQEISLTYEWLWWKRQPAPIMKNTIIKLRYSQTAVVKIGSGDVYDTKSSDATVTIIAPQQKYVISAASEGLVEPEIDWLTHEISKWSGMPVTVEDVRH